MTTKDFIRGIRPSLRLLYGNTNVWWPDRETLRAARGWFKRDSWAGFSKAKRKAIFREVLRIKRGDIKFHQEFRI